MQRQYPFPGAIQFTKAACLASYLIISPAWLASAAETEGAPASDRVGFPNGYQTKFQVLRTVQKKEEQKVVTVFGNEPAASITNAAQLPYPYGSVIVMETASALKDAQGKPVLDDRGRFQKNKVLGLHVMRRERDFGAAYGKNRTGEWEYVEYRADGSYITPSPKSFACAECHLKAGPKQDFVYRGKLSFNEGK